MDRLGLRPQCGRIAIDGVDDAARPEQVSQGQGERASAGAEVGPGRSRALDAAPDQPDVVVMVHRGPRVPG